MSNGHSRTVKSALLEASSVLSWFHVRLVTSALWPLKVPISNGGLLVLTSYRRMTPSLQPVNSSLPSLLKTEHLNFATVPGGASGTGGSGTNVTGGFGSAGFRESAVS